MEIKKIFQTLNKQQVKYLICGGLAVNIYGIPRMTADIDILLDFDERNIVNFENAIKLLAFQSQNPVSIKTFIKEENRKKAITEKNLIAYSYFNSQTNFMNLDVLLDTPIPFNELWKQKSERDLGDVKLSLVSIEHLIELKNYANRLQDKSDVILLSKLLKK